MASPCGLSRPHWRVGSPVPGGSTLITSAPNSASPWRACTIPRSAGPATRVDRWSTVPESWSGLSRFGGDGRFEAIPATEIVKLKARSGAEYRVISDRIGMAYRMCTETLEAANASNRRLAFSCMAFLAAQCTSSGNRQLMDLAGQVFAGQRHFDRAIAMFERALDQDSNAINTLVSMAIALHLDRRYEDETSHLRRLLDILPADPQVLRLAIQADTWGGDKELAERAFGLLTQHHPQMALAARGFLDRPSAPPR